MKKIIRHDDVLHGDTVYEEPGPLPKPPRFPPGTTWIYGEYFGYIDEDGNDRFLLGERRADEVEDDEPLLKIDPDALWKLLLRVSDYAWRYWWAVLLFGALLWFLAGLFEGPPKS